MSKRFFINNLDTPIGEEFYRQLVKEETEDGVHMATYTDNNRLDVPKGFKKILKRYKPKLSRKKMLEECDVYIYDLHYCDSKDIDYVSSIFGNPALQLDDQKVLVLISNVMVWSDTPPKQKQVEETKIQQNEADIEPLEQLEPPEPTKYDEEQQPQDINDVSKSQQVMDITQQNEIIPEQQQIIYVPYEEADYKSRNPKQLYMHLKESEDRILALQRENLKVIVVCSGLWYGKGENIFREHFKSAWLQDPFALPYIGEGENKIPTIHISDLVKLVIKVAETPCEQPYVFGIDNTQDRRQSAIIKGISVGVGSGQVQSVEKTQLVPEAAQDYFTFDIDMKPSTLTVGSEEQPSDFEWYCEKGIANHTRKVLEEFWKVHQLRPIKIHMICPTLRKELKFDDITKMISKHYRIPIIDYEEILEKVSQNWEGELSEDFKEEYQKIQQYLQTNQPQTLDETLKLLYMAVKWRLNQNDCVNRGYILDNFPRFFEECDMIFYPNKQKLKRKRKPKKKVKQQSVVQEEHNESKVLDQSNQEAEGEEEEQQPIQQEEQPHEEVQQQEEEQPEEQQEEQEEQQEEAEEEGGPKQEPFFPESVFLIKSLNKSNKVPLPNRLLDFYTDKNIEVQMLDSQNKELYEIFENMRIYIERKGRPYNYLQNDQELVQDHIKYYQTINDNMEKKKYQEEEKKINEKQQKYNSRVKVSEQQIKYILEREQELENYLMDFVVPILNEGLVEVAHILPDDPVEFLSEFLYKKSFEVDKE